MDYWFFVMKNNLVKIRKQLGLSQKEVARKLGYERSYISNIERGVDIPSLRFWKITSQELQIPINKLLKIERPLNSHDGERKS